MSKIRSKAKNQSGNILAKTEVLLFSAVVNTEENDFFGIIQKWS